MASKTSHGNFFEDFQIGQTIAHATPRTLTSGDVAIYTALYGSRFAVQSADTFAQSIGYERAPLDDLLVFHTVFGKTVPDISLNAIANLGYADCRFLKPVFPGDTLSTTSKVIGLRENSNRKTGVVYVRSTGRNQHGGTVVDYVRWVMVRKRDEAAVVRTEKVPELPASVDTDVLGHAVPRLNAGVYDWALAGSTARWDDYEVGERIDHAAGAMIEEAEHQMATRLYQNTARLHFNPHDPAVSRHGKRLVYGGHIISMARALSFNGLANAFHVAGINAGRHVAPAFAGDTVYAWSEILDKIELPGREDIGALRLRTIAVKNLPAGDFPLMADENTYEEGVILDLDYWVLMPR
ncbi:MAG: MaoC family dehydratase [Alphaproteobacteria bacterium]